MAIDETKQYVDWAGLRYYDQRVKEYIDSKFTNLDDQNQFRADLEQLEDRIQTLADNFTTDKAHIYEHIEACKKSSATKEELASSVAALRQEIKAITGVDLTEYATKEFVEDKIRNIGTVELPDNLVTREELAEEIGKISPPEVDLTNLATKEELRDVEAKIPSIDELASEAYVDDKVASIIIPKVPTKVSELENDTGYLTAVPEEYVTQAELDAQGYIRNLDGYATEDYVDEAVAKLVDSAPEELNTLKELSDAISSQKDVLGTFATKTEIEGLATQEFVEKQIADIPPVDLTGYVKEDDLPDTSKFITSIPEEYVTDVELDARGYLTEHQSLEEYAKSRTVVQHKYEVLPIDGMLVLYNDDEVRLNTQRVVPVHQEVGETGNPNMYYATFRAYAPEGANRVIEGLNGIMDSEFSSLATDTYGRKYTTIWSAIANYNGTEWTKWGDTSTVDKYLGFYYNFHWYNEDTLIATDKVRVILTNDACHNDLVPDAVARRIEEKIAAVDYVTTTTVEKIIDEKIEDVINDGATVSSISYGTF